LKEVSDIFERSSAAWWFGIGILPQQHARLSLFEEHGDEKHRTSVCSARGAV
jgi:hypothetical protein